MRIRNCDDHDPGEVWWWQWRYWPGDLGEDDDDNDFDDDDDDDDIEDIDLGERSGTVNDKGNLNHHSCAWGRAEQNNIWLYVLDNTVCEYFISGACNSQENLLKIGDYLFFFLLKTFSIHHFSQEYLLNIGDNTKVCCQGVSCNFRSITFLQNPDCICFTVDLKYVDANVLLGVQMIWWRRFTLKLALGPQQVLQ